MKTWVVGVCAMALSGILLNSAFAANPDNGPGCGLGKLAWSEYKHQKNIAPQVMMATTNGTFGSGTFGISFGTSGCTNDGQVMAEHKTEFFAATIFDSLAQNMAQGKGEHLASLATLMRVPVEHQAEFFALAQEKYVAFVQNGEASPVAVIKALQDAMNNHSVLARVSR
ncbi:MAG: DUF3015 domain-containing protein [Nitrospiraceae bacterium]